VTKLFVGGVIAVITGIILVFASVLLAYANGVFVLQGHDVVGVPGTPVAGTMVGHAIQGGQVIVGGAIATLVSWIGALLNTSQLEEKTWFILLLVLGVVSLGFIAMIAYVIAGPDGTAPRQLRHDPLAQT
jgi:hypothetical protein